MTSLTIHELRARKANRRYFAVNPVKEIALGSDNVLLLHPASGSWVIVAARDVYTVKGLLAAANSGVLDEFSEVENLELIHELHAAGLLYIRGKAAWTNVDFDNSQARLNTLILKMVGYCNIACQYCYDFDHATYKSKLSVEDAKKSIEGALALAGQKLNLLFHGGEPLLAFREIKELVPYARQAAAKSGTELLLSIQTNGTRFTDDIVEFLLEHRFSVGVSLDGPEHLNDVHRVTFKGGGTAAPILTALQRYPQLHRHLGILTTVTNSNCASLRDIARHFRDIGIQCWDVTIFQDAGRAANKKSQFAPDIAALIQSYFDLLDAVEDGEFDDMEMRPVLHYVRNVLSYERRNMCLRNGCGAAKELISISADGTIESCDCISSPSLSLGHIRRQGVGDAIASATGQAIRSRATDKLSPCRTCDWRVFCGGTCLAKSGELDAVDEHECQLSLALFPDILRRLSRSDKLARYAERFD